MIRDPFYQQILQRLAWPLDPELFERCAAALLRSVYPGLVPIRGGTDYGMDGAIADGSGPAFPLVTTASEDVIGNLTRNLKTYVETGGTRRSVVLATSRQLSGLRRKNLHKRAEELGFTLINIHDRAAIADLLYRNPPWCLELLSLPSDPAPLSVVPRTRRPFVAQELVGRERDLAWLRGGESDCLLVGQPGSGKTFLFHHLARAGWGLFVETDDPAKIAAGIRAQEPDVLILDDAHVRHPTLETLLRLRREMGVTVRVVASSWPGGQGRVADLLGLPTAGVRELERLTRDQIVQTIKGAGLWGPDHLIKEMVDQAEGRPGLAVTLAYLCLQGDVRGVVLGDALSRNVRSTLEPLTGAQALDILAGFALGGDAGMAMTEIVSSLGVPLLDVRRATANLAAAGVLNDIGDGRLSVRPPQLRHALVRDVFFAGSTSLPSDALIRAAPNLADTVLTLIGAKGCGAIGVDGWLQALLEQADSAEAWRQYAALGPAESEFVLRRHPEGACRVADVALLRTPEIAIPLLLSAAIGDQRPLHAFPEHPLRVIRDWVARAEPGTGDPVSRRSVLLNAVQTWLAAGGGEDVGLRALCVVFTPDFEWRTTDPGRGRMVTFHVGYLGASELHSLAALWPTAFGMLRAFRSPRWSELLALVQQWAYPMVKFESRPPPEEIQSATRSFALVMLRDIVTLAGNHQGVVRTVRRINRDISGTIDIPVDPEFETLFPSESRYEDVRTLETAFATQETKVERLAVRLMAEGPQSAVPRILLLEAQAASLEVRWPRHTPLLFQKIAKETDSPLTWARVLIDAGGSPEFVLPFLDKPSVRAESTEDYLHLVRTCLQREDLRPAGLAVLLKDPEAPASLLEQVLDLLAGFPHLVEALCNPMQVPEATLRALLRHPDSAVAGAAAVGTWLSEPRGSVRHALFGDWRPAVLRIPHPDQHQGYWLGQIVGDDPQLAHDWMRRYLRKSGDYLGYWEIEHSHALQTIVAALDAEGRWCALTRVVSGFGAEGLVKALLRDDFALYRRFITSSLAREVRLAALAGRPIGTWVEKAEMALDAGFAPEEIASACLRGPHTSGDDAPAYWSSWIKQFDELTVHRDPRIRRVGEIGRQRADEWLERALARERAEEIYGI